MIQQKKKQTLKNKKTNSSRQRQKRYRKERKKQSLFADEMIARHYRSTIKRNKSY